jgi:hypothetical protein
MANNPVGFVGAAQIPLLALQFVQTSSSVAPGASAGFTFTLPDGFVLPAASTGTFGPQVFCFVSYATTAGVALVVQCNPAPGGTTVSVEVYNAGSVASPGTLIFNFLFIGGGQALGA